MNLSHQLTKEQPISMKWPQMLIPKNLGRLLILAGIIVGITLGHYQINIQEQHYHDIFRRLYYLPIILGGLWFQLRGGLITAIIVSMIYAPHVVFQWGSHPDAQWEQYLEIILYNVIGLLTGVLARKEQLQRLELEKTASHLEDSFQKLKEQAKQILTFEEQLLRASRLSALGELSAGLAHEIRNPLGSIRGTAEIIKDPTTDQEQRDEFAEILIREVDRLNQVVTNFLRFAKPIPLGKKSCNLNVLLEELVRLSTVECQRNRISINLSGAELPDIPMDVDQIRQVFLNLIINAAQSMPDGGCLNISTERHGSNASVKFVDTGSGIPQENISKIFNPFFTTRHTGSGLGLAISQRIVQAHGGQIHVESAPKQGTTFEVLFPISMD